MNTVIITSVSPAAAKRAFDKIALSNGLVYIGPNHASSNALAAQLVPDFEQTDDNVQEWNDAPRNAVELKSSYFNEVTLLEYATKAAGRGTVKAG